jgi:hypothetical protein
VNTALNVALVALACSVGVVPACSANIHDNAVNIDAQLSVTANTDVSNVQPGSTIPVTIDASNVFPVPPDQTPPQGHETDAVFFKFFIDDDTSDANAVLVTPSLSVNVQINSDVHAGPHKLICRMYKHDGTPTTATSSIDFTVKASVGPSTGADAAGMDASAGQ